MNSFRSSNKQLSLFTTAGYPQLDSLNEQLSIMEAAGIDFVEVGIPFSDPLADGPVIQETSKIALENGMNVSLLFDQLSQRTSRIPVVLMGYLNPVLSFGMKRFLEHCRRCEIRTVILPDLSMEIYQRDYQLMFEDHDVSPAFLVTPLSTNERIELAAKLPNNSFVYLVSGNVTTGAHSSALAANDIRYQEVRALCGSTPVFIGFGIRTKEDVVTVHKNADGAIIGSAFLEALSRGEQTLFLSSIRS